MVDNDLILLNYSGCRGSADGVHHSAYKGDGGGSLSRCIPHLRAKSNKDTPHLTFRPTFETLCIERRNSTARLVFLLEREIRIISC